MKALAKTQTDKMAQARERGFLICAKSRNEELIYAWVEDCRERNEPCVYALLHGQVGDIVVMLTTSDAPRRRACFEEIGVVCKRFVRCHDFVSSIPFESYRVKWVSLDRLHDACNVISMIIRDH